MRHYSKYKLNTYSTTPYFEAHIPKGYPLEDVLIAARRFHNLPPRLRALADRAKQWAIRNYPYPAGIQGIEEYYDAEGYELDTRTGARMSDEDLNAEWDAVTSGKPAKIVDIPEPPGGFPDPDTWKQPPPAPDPDEEDLTEADILRDVQNRGPEAAAEEYGVSAAGLPADAAAAARHILAERARRRAS